MKDWLVCGAGEHSHWLTRVDVLPTGREVYKFPDPPQSDNQQLNSEFVGHMSDACLPNYFDALQALIGRAQEPSRRLQDSPVV